MGDWLLHLNGFSYHFEGRDDNNERNWGIGLQGYIHRSEAESWLWRDWLSFWEFDIYQDSFYDLAALAGFGTQRKFLLDWLDFGFRGGLIYEAEFERKIGTPIIPYVLPFFETDFDFRLNARLTVVPPVSSEFNGVVAVQLIIRL